MNSRRNFAVAFGVRNYRVIGLPMCERILAVSTQCWTDILLVLRTVKM